LQQSYIHSGMYDRMLTNASLPSVTNRIPFHRPHAGVGIDERETDSNERLHGSRATQASSRSKKNAVRVVGEVVPV